MTIYIIDLEPIDTRYTKQWREFIPNQIEQYSFLDVVNISGNEIPPTTTPGAFLDFSATNNYKSSQLQKISQLFSTGKVKDGDYFLYTDAWNPTVIQLKYMASLINVDIKIGGLWHAGSYDDNDFLGRLIGNTPWIRHAERSMYECYDHNFFATDYHKQLFCYTFGLNSNSSKIYKVGWPMEYLQATLRPTFENKENLIVFPHRIAPEKQVDIFYDLKKEMPEFDFVVCQENSLSKDQYHSILDKAKIVFSANLQETLGISTCAEGPIFGVIPLAPNRLSYTEIFKDYDNFLYPSEWTLNFELYQKHKHNLIDKIRYTMYNYDRIENDINRYLSDTYLDFFSGNKLYKKVTNEY